DGRGLAARGRLRGGGAHSPLSAPPRAPRPRSRFRLPTHTPGGAPVAGRRRRARSRGVVPLSARFGAGGLGVKVLHILDHSVPVMSGYSTRSRNIAGFQRELGLTPVVITSAKHPAPGPAREERDGITYYRTSDRRDAEPGGPGPVTSGYAGSLALMRRFAARIAEVARAEGATLLHAHSPVLNGL